MSNHVVIHPNGSIELRYARTLDDVRDRIGWTGATEVINLRPRGHAIDLTGCLVGSFDPVGLPNKLAADVLTAVAPGALAALTAITGPPLRGPVAFFTEATYVSTPAPSMLIPLDAAVGEAIGNVAIFDIDTLLGTDLPGVHRGIAHNPNATTEAKVIAALCST